MPRDWNAVQNFNTQQQTNRDWNKVSSVSTTTTRNWDAVQSSAQTKQQPQPLNNVNQEFAQKHPFINKALQTAGNVLSAPLRALDKVPFIKRAGEQARSRILMDDSQVQTDTGSKFGNVAADITGAALGYLTPLPGGQSLLGASYQAIGKPVEKAVQGVTKSKVLPALARGSAEAGTLAAVEGTARGEKGGELAKRVAIEASLGGVLDAGLTTAISKVLKRFGNTPVPSEAIERDVAKEIGVDWDNLNNTQKNKIKDLVSKMQGKAVAEGNILPPTQDFQFFEPLQFKTKQPRPFEQVKPKEVNSQQLALPPGQDFQLVDSPLQFKKTVEMPKSVESDINLRSEIRNQTAETAVDDFMDPKRISRYSDIGNSDIYTSDVFRNFKKVFGESYETAKKTILDPFDASKAKNVDFQKQWTDRLKTDIVDGLGIQKGSRLSKLVQRYGEKTITPEELASLTPDELARIKQADQWFRGAYDQLLDNVNAVRAKIYPNNPEKIVPKRQDYYRHFQDLKFQLDGLNNLFDNAANVDPNLDDLSLMELIRMGYQRISKSFNRQNRIDPKLEGISPFTKPKSKFAGFMQQRTGYGNYTDDAVGGFLNYLPSASYSINIDPQISVFRNMAKNLRETTENSKNLNNFINYLEKYSNDLAGKTNDLDRSFQDFIGRDKMRVLNWLNSRVKANVILGNVGSALSQLGNIPQGIGFAKQYSIPGIRRTLRSIVKPNEAIRQSGFIKERFADRMYRQFDVETMDSLRNMAVYMMEQSDRIGTEFIWNSVYEKAIREGMQNPIKYADDMTRYLVAGRGIGETTLAQKSKLVQILLPFTVEVGNLIRVQKDMLKSKDIAGLLTMYAAAFIYNGIMERTRGSRVVFDPIDALRDALTEEDLSPLERAGRVAGEVISAVPGGQFLASVYPEYGGEFLTFKDMPTRKQLFGQNDPTRFGTGLLAMRAARNPLTYAIPPFGGMQISKTLRGADAAIRGGVYDKDKKGNDILKYPVDTTNLSTAKGLLFGPSGFSETKDYYENDRRPLSDNQTKQVQQNPQAYSVIIRNRQINSIKQKVDDVRKDKNLNVEQKRQEIDKLMKQLQRLRGGQ